MVFLGTDTRLGSGSLRYPPHGIDWREGRGIHTPTVEYVTYASLLFGYNRESSEELVRLGNHMEIVAGGFRLAARELLELNFRGRSHLSHMIKEYRHVYPSIAGQLIDIAERGVLPEYSGHVPVGQQSRNYPYAKQGTEKIVSELWMDVRAAIMVISIRRLRTSSGPFSLRGTQKYTGSYDEYWQKDRCGHPPSQFGI